MPEMVLYPPGGDSRILLANMLEGCQENGAGAHAGSVSRNVLTDVYRIIILEIILESDRPIKLSYLGEIIRNKTGSFNQDIFRLAILLIEQISRPSVGGQEETAWQ